MSDQRIDEILKDVSSVDVYQIKQFQDFDKKDEEYKSYQRLISIKMITELNLLILVASNKVILSDKGNRIIEDGGWLAHLASSKEKKRQESEKLKYDLKTSKIKSKTFIPILFLGAIGGVYSLKTVAKLE